MANKSVFSRPIPDANRPRNGFDRSFMVTENSSFGMITPVFAELLPAGSHCKINRSEFFRTAAVNTAAFLNFDHFIDFVAVPIKQVWSYYDDWMLNIKDMNSSFFNLFEADVYDNPVLPASLPAVTISEILNALDSPGQPSDGSGIFSRSYTGRRLLNRLDYAVCLKNSLADGIEDDYGYMSDYSNKLNNLVKLCCYQKAYFDHYRNTAYEDNNPFSYSMDWIGTSTPSPDVVNRFVKGLCTMRYKDLRKDMFQVVYPGLNYVVSNPTGLSWQLPSNLGQLAGNTVNVDLLSDSGSVVVNSVFNSSTGYDNSRWRLSDGSVMTSSAGVRTNTNGSNLIQDNPAQNIRHDHLFSTASSLSVQSIRAAFALDKLMRASAFAPKHVKDQYEARFGFKYRGRGNESTFLGSFKCTINVNEVVQTTPNSSDGSSLNTGLGDIGGKGVGSAGFEQPIEYDAMEGDVMILGLSYFLPRIMYDAFLHNPFNTKLLRTDFFQPEFEKLGLQPFYFGSLRAALGTNKDNGDRDNNQLIGWQDRYIEYKTNYDRNRGLFTKDQPLEIYSSHFVPTRHYTFDPNNSGTTYVYFKCNPLDGNDFFVTAADGTELSDQFFGKIAFQFLCNQNMSVHSQPDL